MDDLGFLLVIFLVMLGQFLTYKKDCILVECCEAQLSQNLKALLHSFFPLLFVQLSRKNLCGVAWKWVSPPAGDHQRSSFSPSKIVVLDTWWLPLRKWVISQVSGSILPIPLNQLGKKPPTKWDK